MKAGMLAHDAYRILSGTIIGAGIVGVVWGLLNLSNTLKLKKPNKTYFTNLVRKSVRG